MSEFESAETVKDESGKQYHLGLKPDDICSRIILVGDPARAQRISTLFETDHVSRRHREFVSFSGCYKGLDLTVVATGIGCDNTEIAVIELCQLKFPLTMIRCGTCGALQPDINLGDVVISAGAVRLENTSAFFVEPGYPAVASHEVVLALLKAAFDARIPHHLGITATAAGFYGCQGRHVAGFPLRDNGLIERLTTQGIKNVEMETSALFTLASLRGFRAGSVCAVFASRPGNNFIKPEKMQEAEDRAIRTTLEAFEVLNKMDNCKGNLPLWLPEFPE